MSARLFSKLLILFLTSFIQITLNLGPVESKNFQILKYASNLINSNNSIASQQFAEYLKTSALQCVHKNHNFEFVGVPPDVSVYSSVANLEKYFAKSQTEILIAMGEIRREFVRMMPNYKIDLAGNSVPAQIQAIFQNVTNKIYFNDFYPSDAAVLQLVIQIGGKFFKVSNTMTDTILVIVNKNKDFNDLTRRNTETLINTMESKSWHTVFFEFYENSEKIMQLINSAEINKVLVILENPKETLKLLIQANKLGFLNWNYKWLIFDLYGDSTLMQSTELNIFSQNLTTISFESPPNKKKIVKSELEGDMFLVTKKWLEMIFCDLNLNTRSVKGSTGNFIVDVTSMQRIDYNFTISKGFGSFKSKVANAVIPSNNPTTAALPTVNFDNFVFNYTEILSTFQTRPFKIGFLISEPWVMFKDGQKLDSASTVPYAERLKGFSVEFWKLLMAHMNLTYEFVPLTQTSPGKYDEKLNSFNGYLNEVYNGNIQSLAFPIVLDTQIITRFDYTKNYLTGSYSILHNPRVTLPGIGFRIFDFFLYMHWHIWLAIIGLCLVYACSLTLSHKFFYQQRNNDVKYSFGRSLFFVFSSLNQIGYYRIPLNVTSRFIMVGWMLFALLFSVTFVCVITSEMLRRYLFVSNLKEFETFINQNDVSLFTYRDSYLLSTLEASGDVKHRQLFNDLTIQNTPGLINESLTLAVSYLNSKFVQTNAGETSDDLMNRYYNPMRRDGRYGFIWEKHVNNYLARKYCWETSVDEFTFEYGLIFQRNSFYLMLLAKNLEKITTTWSGLLNKYWPKDAASQQPSAQCDIDQFEQITTQIDSVLNNPFPKSLSLADLSGIFIILLVGCLAAVLLSLIEFIIRKILQKVIKLKRKQTETVGLIKSETKTK